MFTNKIWTSLSLDDVRDKIRAFLESVYFQNRGHYSCKLCFLRCAFARQRTGLILFNCGDGENGQGMDAVFDRNVLGDAGIMDCACLMDRIEFRKLQG